MNGILQLFLEAVAKPPSEGIYYFPEFLYWSAHTFVIPVTVEVSPGHFHSRKSENPAYNDWTPACAGGVSVRGTLTQVSITKE